MKEIGTSKLRDRRVMRLLKVSCPEPERIEELSALLGHKGESWVWHMKECLNGRTPGLDTHFYLGEVEGRFVGNVTLFQNGNLGNISHVFTRAEFRGQRIAKILLQACLDHFEAEYGRVIVLGTGFQTMPWRLYESFGFFGVCPEQSYGGMIRFFADADWNTFLSGLSGTVCQAAWRHFVGMQILFGAPGPTQLRSVLLPSIGPRLVEEQFIRLQWKQSQGEPVEARVIEGNRAGIVGCALVGMHPFWRESCRRKILDLHVAAAGADRASELIESALDKIKAPVECYCDTASEEKMENLKKCGFKEETRLASYCQFGQTITGLAVMVRE